MSSVQQVCSKNLHKTRIKCLQANFGKLLQQVGLGCMLLIVGGPWGVFWYVAGRCVQRTVQQVVQRSGAQQKHSCVTTQNDAVGLVN